MARKSHLDRQIELSEALIRNLRDIHSTAKHFGLSHEEMLQRIKIYVDAEYKKLTAYYRGRVDGARDEMFNAMYRNDLEWRLNYNGKLVKSEDIPAGQWQYVDGGKHVWKHRPDKVFY